MRSSPLDVSRPATVAWLEAGLDDLSMHSMSSLNFFSSKYALTKLKSAEVAVAGRLRISIPPLSPRTYRSSHVRSKNGACGLVEVKPRSPRRVRNHRAALVAPVVHAY